MEEKANTQGSVHKLKPPVSRMYRAGKPHASTGDVAYHHRSLWSAAPVHTMRHVVCRLWGWALRIRLPSCTRQPCQARSLGVFKSTGSWQWPFGPPFWLARCYFAKNNRAHHIKPADGQPGLCMPSRQGFQPLAPPKHARLRRLATDRANAQPCALRCVAEFMWTARRFRASWRNCGPPLWRGTAPDRPRAPATWRQHLWAPDCRHLR